MLQALWKTPPELLTRQVTLLDYSVRSLATPSSDAIGQITLRAAMTSQSFLTVLHCSSELVF